MDLNVSSATRVFPQIFSKINFLNKFQCFNYKVCQVKLNSTKFSGSSRAKINFGKYNISRMGPFKNLAGINFRDRGKSQLNFLIFMRILTIFCISRVILNVRFHGYKLSRTPKKIREIAKVYIREILYHKVSTLFSEHLFFAKLDLKSCESIFAFSRWISYFQSFLVF